jgi:hypothetical protein
MGITKAYQLDHSGIVNVDGTIIRETLLLSVSGSRLLSHSEISIRIYYRDYSVFGLWPSSCILKNSKEHNVSGTGSVSVLREVMGDTYSAGSVKRANTNPATGVSHPLI